jgi:hypothetical protein
MSVYAYGCRSGASYAVRVLEKGYRVILKWHGCKDSADAFRQRERERVRGRGAVATCGGRCTSARLALSTLQPRKWPIACENNYSTA